MKKLLSLLLTATFVLSGLSACRKRGVESEESSSKNDLAVIWSAENTERYMLDDVPTNPTLNLSIEAIKGETESIQLMITASKDVSSFSVSVGDLVSSNGEVISKTNVEIFAERYIETVAVFIPTHSFLLINLLKRKRTR